MSRGEFVVTSIVDNPGDRGKTFVVEIIQLTGLLFIAGYDPYTFYCTGPHGEGLPVCLTRELDSSK